jgi:amidase
MATLTEGNWEQIAANKRSALAEQIPLEYRIPSHLFPPHDQLDVTTFPRESGWFDERELEITESSATNILNKIASRSWTSEQVTRAFCKRAAAAQQLVWPRFISPITYPTNRLTRPTV